MTDAEMLSTVKAALNIVGSYHDSALAIYIKEVNEYLKAAGVPESLINSSASAGTVSRGVADLWNYGAGEGKLSPYFYERVIQMAGD